MNELIAIGHIGMKKCYLNITEELAIERYCNAENMSRLEFDEQDITISIIEFEDEFDAYEVWEI